MEKGETPQSEEQPGCAARDSQQQALAADNNPMPDDLRGGEDYDTAALDSDVGGSDDDWA